MAGSFVGSTRATRVNPASSAGHGFLLSPGPIRDRTELSKTAALLGDRASEAGVEAVLVQTAFATLIDNALEHGHGLVSA